MACQPSQLLEAVSRCQPCVRRAEPRPSAAAGWTPPLDPSCKQQLGSGPKVFRCRCLVPRPGLRGSCKQQLGFGPSLYLATPYAPSRPSTSILQTTSLWFAASGGLILQTA